MAEIKKVESNVGGRQVKKVESERTSGKKSGFAARLMDEPESLTRDDMIQAQNEVGNQAIQRKLDTSFAKDKETEGTLSKEMTDKIQSKRGSGSALPEQVSKSVGKQLGHDLGGVRIHTDSEADKLTRSVQARAFTIGRDIFFKSGVYAPDSERGRETIIHELTHVVQQSKSSGGRGKLKLGAPDTSMEKEADKTGKKLAGMSFKAGAAGAVGAAGSTVQRAAEEEELLQGQREPVLQRAAEEEELLQGQREPVIQRAAEEEELLQGQREPVIQRAEEEELLQGQREPVIQRTEEEELLQGQREPVIQREGPEEEEPIQMQAEEDELQMQPDGMIQRDLLDEIKKEKAKREQAGGPAKGERKVKRLERRHNRKVLSSKTIEGAKEHQEKVEEKTKELGDERKKLGIGSKKNLKNLAKLDEGREKKDKEDRENLFKAEKEDKKTKSRNALMAKIRDKNTSSEDAKSAKEQLDMLHKRGKWDTFKSAFTPGKTTKSYSEQAEESRKIGLKSEAEGGDQKAFEKYKAEKAERKEAKKNSTSGKVKGFLGKAGMGLLGFAGGALKKQFGNVKEHYFGKSDDKDEDEEKKPSSKGSENVGAGFGSMMEKYGELVRQNEDLKRKLEKYESQKSG